MSKLSDLKKKTLKNYETTNVSQSTGQTYQATNVTIAPEEEEKKSEKENFYGE